MLDFRFIFAAVLNFFFPLLVLAAPVEKTSTSPEPTFQEKVKETAQETSAAIEQTADKVAQEIKTSRFYRSENKYQLGLDFSFLDFVLPGKYGLHAQYLKTPDTTYEVSYLKGSMSVPFFIGDLGGITEERFSFLVRQFYGTNSFNFFYGVTYFNFHVDLGNEYLQSVSPTQRSVYDVVQLQSLGAQIGLGHRWHLHKNIVLGVDWVAWSQPIFETYRNSDFVDVSSDEGRKDNVRKALSVLSYLPRLSLVKVQLAWSF